MIVLAGEGICSGSTAEDFYEGVHAFHAVVSVEGLAFILSCVYRHMDMSVLQQIGIIKGFAAVGTDDLFLFQLTHSSTSSILSRVASFTSL